MRTFVTHNQARLLLHNKFVVILGGSVQRSVYKDLVLLLQRDQYLTLSQLKSKGEFSFEQDILVEGGRLGPMTNSTEYREVRQYRTDHHLVRFYFLTRIYSPYMESVLEDFRQGPRPDIIFISSCVWDITRYGLERIQHYKENLHQFFSQIKTTVFPDCLLLWALAMPLSKRIKGGFLVPEISHLGPTVCYDVIEANFYSSRLADAYGLDVLDLHYHFRLSLQHRMPDGVHWDAVAHRHISTLVLQHVADTWGVKLHDPPSPRGQGFQDNRKDVGHHSFRPQWPRARPQLDAGPAKDIPAYVSLRPHINRQQNFAAVRVDQFRHWLPVQRYHPPWQVFRATGNHLIHCRQGYDPFPLTNLWPGHHVHHHRATCSQMDFRLSAGGSFHFRPCFQADYHFVRRRRRPNVRTHPYPLRPIGVTPRHVTYR